MALTIKEYFAASAKEFQAQAYEAGKLDHAAGVRDSAATTLYTTGAKDLREAYARGWMHAWRSST